MNITEKQPGPSGFWKRKPLPRAARYIDTAIAIVLLGLSIYHFTQPEAAWRSGVTEIVLAAVLLTSAYLVPYLIAVSGHAAVAIVTAIAGVRHVIHGGGWKSGTVELLFAVTLITITVIIYRNRGK